jgi:hypothetical protein
MDRLARERQEKDPDTADALREAATQGHKEGLAGDMSHAHEQIRNNQLGDARKAQQKAVETLETVARSLEERREKDLDRLSKKLKEAASKLADLTQRQEQLRKKIKEAGQLADAQERKRELRRLAREQERLAQEAQLMVRELTRLRASRARQELSEAVASMQRTGQQLQQGDEPEESPEETLDRLNEAQRRLSQDQEQVEEALMRERLAKVADEIKHLKERQDAAIAEAERLQKRVLQEKNWVRSLKSSLSQLAHNQEQLGQETANLASAKLGGAPVLARLAQRSAEAMKKAAGHCLKQLDRANDDEDAIAAEPETAKFQRDAVHRLEQLLEVLKPEKGMARNAQGAGEGGPAKSPRGGGSDLPPLAQLKALRLLQQELYARTETAGKRPTERELQEIRREQQELARLLEELTNPSGSEGQPK